MISKSQETKTKIIKFMWGPIVSYVQIALEKTGPNI